MIAFTNLQTFTGEKNFQGESKRALIDIGKTFQLFLLIEENFAITLHHII